MSMHVTIDDIMQKIASCVERIGWYANGYQSNVVLFTVYCLTIVNMLGGQKSKHIPKYSPAGFKPTNYCDNTAIERACLTNMLWWCILCSHSVPHTELCSLPHKPALLWHGHPWQAQQYSGLWFLNKIAWIPGLSVFPVCQISVSTSFRTIIRSFGNSQILYLSVTNGTN